jgi:hypothetical protein
MAPVRLAMGRLYLLCAKDKVKLTKTIAPASTPCRSAKARLPAANSACVKMFHVKHFALPSTEFGAKPGLNRDFYK